MVAVGAVAVGLDARDDGDRSVLDTATRPTTSTPSAPDNDPASLPRAGEDVELTADGTVLAAPGVTITRTVDHPYGTVLPDRSVGLEYTKAGTAVWALLTYVAGEDHQGGHFRRSSDPAGTAFDNLDDWLLSFNTIDGSASPDESGSAPDDFVRFGSDTSTTLVARPGVALLDQSDHLALPASIAGPDDVTAVAEVRREGTRWFVLARRQPGCPAEYVAVPAETFGDSLADYAAAPLDRLLPIYPTGDEPIEAIR